MSPTWTCARCGVTATFLAGAEAPSQPAGWVRRANKWYCLGCQREQVREAASGETEAERSAAQRRALTEFELLRDPSAGDQVIAKRTHFSPAHIRQVRAALRESGKLS